ncbi:MAG: hypothetical protein P8126_08645 [Gammaproteobacteria bacterium]|jgi:hypothetical protein
MERVLMFFIAIVFSFSAMAMTHSGKHQKAQKHVAVNLPPFSKIDTNHDKILTWKEAKAAGIPKKLFDSADYNHNGKITQTMYKYDIKANNG